MRDRLSDYQEMYGDLYNLEATPAESTSYRLAKHDVERYPDIITAYRGGQHPLLHQQLAPACRLTPRISSRRSTFRTNSRLCTRRARYSMHSSARSSRHWKSAANLVRKIAENYKLPYYTLSARPTPSARTTVIIPGEHYKLRRLRSKDRGIQPYYGLLPPRSELERRKGTGVQGEKGLQR